MWVTHRFLIFIIIFLFLYFIMAYEKEEIKLGGKKITIKKGALSNQLWIPIDKDIPNFTDNIMEKKYFRSF